MISHLLACIVSWFDITKSWRGEHLLLIYDMMYVKRLVVWWGITLEIPIFGIQLSPNFLMYKYFST